MPERRSTAKVGPKVFLQSHEPEQDAKSMFGSRQQCSPCWREPARAGGGVDARGASQRQNQTRGPFPATRAGAGHRVGGLAGSPSWTQSPCRQERVKAGGKEILVMESQATVRGHRGIRGASSGRIPLPAGQRVSRGNAGLPAGRDVDREAMPTFWMD